jgi:hypothetical protein
MSPWPISGRVKLACDIASRTKPRFIDIPRERRSNVPFTEEEPNSTSWSYRRGTSVEADRLPNCLQIDLITQVTPVALRRLVFGENSAQSAIELIRTKRPPRLRDRSEPRQWGLLVLPPRGKKRKSAGAADRPYDGQHAEPSPILGVILHGVVGPEDAPVGAVCTTRR